MVQKNTITFSIIIVVIIIAYVWLTDSNQWGQGENTNSITALPPDDSDGIAESEYHSLKVTALLEPNAIFVRLVSHMPGSDTIFSQIDYLLDPELAYREYVNALLTTESGEIHLIPNEWVLPLAVQGYLMPLDRVLTSEYAEDQTVAMMESLKWNRSIWATPVQLNPYVVLPHQSLAPYFEHQALEDAVELEAQSSEDGAVKAEQSETGSSSDAIGTNSAQEFDLEEEPIEPAHTSFYKVIEALVNEQERSFTLVNVNEHRIDELFHFIHAYERNGISAPQKLSLNQINLMQKLEVNPSLLSYSSLDELVSQEELPLFLVVDWESLKAQYDFVESHYSVEQGIVPIHWANGYSFVIKHQTEQHQLAGHWLEALHREMSTMNQTIHGMPIHISNLTRLNLDWQERIAAQFNDQFDLLSTMNVSINWPTDFERIDELWKSNATSSKIEAWLNTIEP